MVITKKLFGFENLKPNDIMYNKVKKFILKNCTI